MTDENFGEATFEEKMEMLYSSMSDKQRRDSQEQVKFMCKDYCGKCPSYVGSNEDKFGFCISGKSSKIHEKKGCLCKECSISKTMSLRWEYYCTEGSALDLSKAEK